MLEHETGLLFFVQHNMQTPLFD